MRVTGSHASSSASSSDSGSLTAVYLLDGEVTSTDGHNWRQPASWTASVRGDATATCSDGGLHTTLTADGQGAGIADVQIGFGADGKDYDVIASTSEFFALKTHEKRTVTGSGCGFPPAETDGEMALCSGRSNTNDDLDSTEDGADATELHGSRDDAHGAACAGQTTVSIEWDLVRGVTDADHDGIPDIRDNCPPSAAAPGATRPVGDPPVEVPATWNPDQADVDDDGIGDACEHVSLTVTKAGNGAGTATSEPAGIDCGGVCSAAFDNGVSVVLTAAPAVGSVFTRWDGDCQGTGTCTVAMSEDRSVTAEFAAVNHTLTVDRAGSGSGTVRGDGIECGLQCSHEYGAGATVALTPYPAPGSTFDHWEGACTGAGNCIVTMNQDKAVTAVFVAGFSLSVLRSGDGHGTVTGGGIDCGAVCERDYSPGTHVPLSATAAPGSSFSHWQGQPCADVPGPSCAFTMNQDRQVAAVFVNSRKCYHTTATAELVPYKATQVQADHTTEVHWCVESGKIDLTGPPFTSLAFRTTPHGLVGNQFGFSERDSSEPVPSTFAGEGTDDATITTYPQVDTCTDWATLASWVPFWSKIGTAAWHAIPPAFRTLALLKGRTFLFTFVKYSGGNWASKKLLAAFFKKAQKSLFNNSLPTSCVSVTATMVLHVRADGGATSSVKGASQYGYTWQAAGTKTHSLAFKQSAFAKPNGSMVVIARAPAAGTLSAAAQLRGKRGAAAVARVVTLAKGRRAVRQAGPVSLVLRPTKAGTRLRRRKRTATVKVRVTFTTTAGRQTTSTLRARFGVPHARRPR